jgi:hypothetical protein
MDSAQCRLDANLTVPKIESPNLDQTVSCDHSNTSWRLTPSDYVFLFCAKMYQGSLMLRLWEPFSTAIFAEEKGGQEQTKGLNVGKF